MNSNCAISATKLDLGYVKRMMYGLLSQVDITANNSKKNTNISVNEASDNSISVLPLGFSILKPEFLRLKIRPQQFSPSNVQALHRETINAEIDSSTTSASIVAELNSFIKDYLSDQTQASCDMILRQTEMQNKIKIGKNT